MSDGLDETLMQARSASPSLRAALLDAEKRLKEAKIDDAGLEAEVLLRYAMATAAAQPTDPLQRQGRVGDLVKPVSRAELFGGLSNPVAPAVLARYESLLERRLAYEPTAYITAQREFYGLDFAVTPAVLIPRPETETLVECAADLAQKREPRARLVVADVGTGSGAIAVALARALPRAEVYATDVSSAALTVGSENARRHGLGKRLSFLRGDMLSPLRERVDLIVSNPPYVKTSGWFALPPEIRDHEPRGALDGGIEGLDVIRRLLEEALHYLRADGALCMEFGEGQQKSVLEVARTAFPSASIIDVRQDLAGRPRVLRVVL
jgi:release factor glutamine methyltransferase